MDSPSTRRATVKAPSTRPTVRPTLAAPAAKEPRSASSPRVGSFSYRSSDKNGSNPNGQGASPRQQVNSGARKTFVAGADREERSPLSRPVLPAAMTSNDSNDDKNRSRHLNSSGRNSPEGSFTESAQRSQSEVRPGTDAPKTFSNENDQSAGGPDSASNDLAPSAAMSASPTSTRKFVPASESVEPELHQDYNFFALSTPSDTPSNLKTKPVLSSSRKGSPPLMAAAPTAAAAAPPSAPNSKAELSPHFSHYVAPDTPANDAPAKPKPVLSSSSSRTAAAAAGPAANSTTNQPELSPHFNYYVAPDTQASSAPLKPKPALSSSSSSSKTASSSASQPPATQQPASQQLGQNLLKKEDGSKGISMKKPAEAPSDELQDLVSRAVNEAVANAIGSMATQFGLLAERAETSALAHVQAQLTALQDRIASLETEVVDLRDGQRLLEDLAVDQVDAGSKATTPAGKNKSRVRKSKTKLQPPPPPPPLHEVETLLKSSAALGKYVQPCLERGLILVIQLHRLQDSFLKDTLGMSESDIVSLRNALMDHACAYAAESTKQSSSKKKKSNTSTASSSLPSVIQLQDFLLGTWKSSTNVGRWHISSNEEDNEEGASFYCALLPSANMLKKQRAAALNSGPDEQIEMRFELIARPVRCGVDRREYRFCEMSNGGGGIGYARSDGWAIDPIHSNIHEGRIVWRRKDDPHDGMVIWTRESAATRTLLSQPLPPLPSDSAPLDTVDELSSSSPSSPGSLRFFVKLESGDVSAYHLLPSGAAANNKKDAEHPRYYVKAISGDLEEMSTSPAFADLPINDSADGWNLKPIAQSSSTYSGIGSSSSSSGSGGGGRGRGGSGRGNGSGRGAGRGSNQDIVGVSSSSSSSSGRGGRDATSTGGRGKGGRGRGSTGGRERGSNMTSTSDSNYGFMEVNSDSNAAGGMPTTSNRSDDTAAAAAAAGIDISRGPMKKTSSLSMAASGSLSSREQQEAAAQALNAKRAVAASHAREQARAARARAIAAAEAKAARQKAAAAAAAAALGAENATYTAAACAENATEATGGAASIAETANAITSTTSTPAPAPAATADNHASVADAAPGADSDTDDSFVDSTAAAAALMLAATQDLPGGAQANTISATADQDEAPALNHTTSNATALQEAIDAPSKNSERGIDESAVGAFADGDELSL